MIVSMDLLVVIVMDLLYMFHNMGYDEKVG